MKVLVNALSASIGGGWTNLVNLVRELDRDPRGMIVTILVSANAADKLPPFHGQVRSVSIRSSLLRVAYEQSVLPWLSRNFDVLYCIADLAPWIKMTPTVATLCNLNIYDRRFYDTRRLQMLEWGVRLGLRGLRSIVFPTAAAENQIRELLGIGDIRSHVIHHAIDAENFAERTDHASIESGDLHRYLLIPAAIERHKNLDVVIRALALTEDSDLEVHVVGTCETDPHYVSELRRLASELGVAARVQFLGGVAYDEIPGLYHAAAAVCLSSWIETFGLPVLESMVAGRPILLSDRPVFREIAGEAGWYFDPGRPESLARILDQLRLAPREVEERIEIGVQRSRAFSWSAAADHLHRVLVEAAAGP